MSIIPLEQAHAASIAHLHAEALAGDFLPSLGENFLREFYNSALRTGSLIGFVDIQEQQLIGFICGSHNTPKLFWNVLADSVWRLGWYALPELLHRPSLLVKAAETCLYPQRASSATVKAELLVIAVKKDWRSRGIGAALVKALEIAFLASTINSYKVTVLQANDRANSFYDRLGFQMNGKFNLHRREWNLYIRNLNEAVT